MKSISFVPKNFLGWGCHEIHKVGWVGWVMNSTGWGGWDNRCYFYLSQMQNDANCCGMSLCKVIWGGSRSDEVGWIMQGWDGVGSCKRLGGVDQVGVGWVM